MKRGPTLTIRRWDAGDGNPASPEHVLGIQVDRLLAQRTDAPGALVELHDRRFALTGPLAAIGRHRVLRTYVRERSYKKHDEPYREWLREVSEILEGMRPESRMQWK
jgi:hypothetical protein